MIFKKKQAQQDAKALLEMYKAGFMDGRRAKHFKNIAEACKKAFDKRFIKQMGIKA